MIQKYFTYKNLIFVRTNLQNFKLHTNQLETHMNYIPLLKMLIIKSNNLYQ